MISPPVNVNGASAGTRKSNPIPAARMGYFNLHGLVDSGEWFGQRDPQQASDGPDYPVALRPLDIGAGNKQNNHCTPQVVFSEACYGAHILGKTPENAIALKFLQSGTQVVAGATCMAYGSVSAPLIAADLLGHAFWSGLREGLAAGEALRRAKIRLASEMHDRQGYLDGEDQKTLISFILYGDPLAQSPGPQRSHKGITRPLRTPAHVKTVCDRSTQNTAGQPVPPEVLVYVKHVVEQYLPGMANAQLTFTDEHAYCTSENHVCPTRQFGSKGSLTQQPGRHLVTLSKQIERSDHIHRHYARLTLDSQGKLVKLAVSR
jgi:hypothetical protein